MQVLSKEKCNEISAKIKIYCESKGIRYPIKKVLVAEHLENLNAYTDAPTIYIGMRSREIKISHAAVYDSLRWLTRHGFTDCKPGTHGTSNGSIYRVSPDVW